MPMAQAEGTDSFSRGLQLAKRVATLENSDDVPSRAFWLSRRCINNSKKKKLSFQNASEIEVQSAPQQN